MPPVIRPETISSIQSLTAALVCPAPRPAGPQPRDGLRRLLPCGLRDDQLGGGAIRRPHDLEVAADPLADRAGELDLGALEADGADDRGVLARGDVVADGLAVHADLL